MVQRPEEALKTAMSQMIVCELISYNSSALFMPDEKESGERAILFCFFELIVFLCAEAASHVK